MRNYRRNGTPIGDRRVYVVLPGTDPMVWEVNGYKFWEEVDAGLPMEVMMGKFGFERVNELVIIRPGARLRGADLDFVSLKDCDLREANLEEARLEYANLSGADLRNSNLRGADLGCSRLTGTDLSGAWIEGATLTGAIRDPKDHPIDGWTVFGSRLVKSRTGR